MHIENRVVQSILTRFALIFVLFITLSANIIGQAEAISYPSLSSWLQDCKPDIPAEFICRVKRIPSVIEMGKRLAAGETSWLEGEEVVFVYQGMADSVRLFSAHAWPLARLTPTDYWVLVLKVPDSTNAMISYQFLVTAGKESKIDPKTALAWRGPLAPKALVQAVSLRGRLTEETIQSANLAEPRTITVYKPPLRRSQRISAVVYLADGGSVRLIAPYVEPLILSGRIPPVLLVGIHYGKILEGDDPTVSDTRALEYLPGFGKTDARYEAHERFVLNEVIPWAESKFGAPKSRDRRAVFGASNGGTFALSMGFRNPQTFGHIIAFSSGWQGTLSVPKWKKGQAPQHYLLVGKLESSNTRRIVKEWADTISKNGAAVILREPVAGHDGVMWREWFTDALIQAFGRGK